MVARAKNTPSKTADRRFSFTSPLVKLHRVGSRFVLVIPEKITAAIGRRGPVPIFATLNNSVELQASLVPMGAGRHWLQLNTRIREELEIKVGDQVRVKLLVPHKPPAAVIPAEIAEALKEVDVLETFASFPAGKQNHIIDWIERAVRPETREKRVDYTIQFTFRARERAHDRKDRANSRREKS